MAVKEPHGVTVVRLPLAFALPPDRAALLVRDDLYPFALIGRWAGGGALIGSEPIRIARQDEDPFALLDEHVCTAEVMSQRSEGCDAATSLPPEVGHPEAAGHPEAHPDVVGGGWFGWLGYELGRSLEPIGPSPPPAGRGPRFRLAYYDHLLRLDHDGRWWFEALATASREDALRRRLCVLESRAARAPQPRAFATRPWRATPTSAGHALAVSACRDRINAGDLFQANICSRLESRLSGEALDLFAVAASRLEPDRAAFLSDPSGAVASLSPELFLERHGRRVRSAPIKGTRPRPADAALGEMQRAELEASSKDRAENVMIVDLVRNDLGRVCVPGSIQVDALCEARPHAGVWHLVSGVSGVLRPDAGDGDLVRAAFPPGSVSGAPKVAAMNVIAELESTPRALYTGAIGFASPLAGLELSVAIRTFEFKGEQAWLGVGGGVVADSDPSAEAAECATKAAPLLAAIGASLEHPARNAASRFPVPRPHRFGPRPVPRPDPAAGVFETLLIAGGEPVALERHLERLESSVRQLYATTLPDRLGQEIIVAAQPVAQARMRVNARPGGDTVACSIVLRAPVRRSRPVLLEPMTLPGGLGSHKWIDRRLLAALAEVGDAEPLLCDLDGLVLEAGRANVFIVEDGPRVVTPPADGRILPGVTRGRVIELARELALEVSAERIDLDRVMAAHELFVTGAIGGVEPAQFGRSVVGEGTVTNALERAWRSWVGGTQSSGVVRGGAERLPA
jgi:para-aminobenzoate synthetase/4-amino-4-deoxychorismate lyase